ncbi:hypothetical protein KSP40_PGU007916 [Platanthera guangdongensis]|uniref:Uncharacterized protein n=1 Tax=Platanthera guangdongensis TaxID=2320717 RepID=A0ABR2LV71_9ASPA
MLSLLVDKLSLLVVKLLQRSLRILDRGGSDSLSLKHSHDPLTKSSTQASLSELVSAPGIIIEGQTLAGFPSSEESEAHPGTPHDLMESGGGHGGKAAKKKGKKGRQIDPALLGFKVHSNRIMMAPIGWTADWTPSWSGPSKQPASFVNRLGIVELGGCGLAGHCLPCARWRGRR